MNVLITGGGGFIGSELGRFLLTKGHTVTLFDNLEYGYRENFEDIAPLREGFILGDVRSSWAQEAFDGVDVVFHLAGISSLPECEANPSKAFEVNSTSVANILNACRRSTIKRFIFASTSAVYENGAHVRPVSEDADVSPDLIYATTKRCAEQICNSYARNYGMDIVVCRFFNVFGPHQDYKRKHPPFTSYLVRECLAGRGVTIFNTQAAKRDYIYVEDLLVYLDLIMGSQRQYSGEIFNLATGTGYSALDVAKCVFEALGREFTYDQGAPYGFWDKYGTLFGEHFNLSRERIKQEVHKHCIGDNSKITREFRFSPRFDLRSGLRAIIDYQLAAR